MKNRVLSKKHINQPNEYVLTLMEKIGCKVLCDEALDILGYAGCDVTDPNRVKIPRQLVMEAIEAAPREINAFDGDGTLSMTLREGICHYGTGSDCRTTIDLYSGKRRPCMKEGVGDSEEVESKPPLIPYSEPLSPLMHIDMTTSVFGYGAPELNILNAALADMAHSYGLPFFCIAGSSDSKVLDAQAGLEFAMSIYNATLNGCNIIHDCGYLEYGAISLLRIIR